MLSTLINVIAAPQQAFSQLRDKPSILFPILLLMVAISTTTFLFFHLADPELLIDDLLSQNDEMTDVERAEARSSMQSMPTGSLKWISTASGSIGLLLTLFAHAGYYYLASVFTGTKIGYRPWLSFTLWSSIPLLFASIAGLATLLLASGHITLMQLNPFTLTNLLNLDPNLEPNPKALVNTLNNIDLTRLWSIGLMLLGYRLWTQRSWLHCSLVVLLPFITLFSAMVALAL